jgi:hypothetical protein
MENSLNEKPKATPLSIGEAVDALVNDEEDRAIAYLRAHREDVYEFCYQMRDTYGDNSTPFIKLGMLIDKLL